MKGGRMNAKDKPHAPKTPKIRAILADTTLTTSARLAAVELYCHTDWMTGELVCRHTIAAHIRRTIGVKESASKAILKQLRERGYIKGAFFVPVAEPTGRQTDRAADRPGAKPTGRQTDRAADRPPPVGKPTTPPVGKPTTPGRQTDHISSSPSSSLPSPSSDPRRPDTREESLEGERGRDASTRRTQAEEERQRREQFNAETRAFLNTY